ncbi:uncharacterized protein LOC129917135 [Episyrphus balteatus]|uniref:uncharacterized protein LOC129917135 n=1 Tax=Episyrphus balteatus TaxID=286459 RepID=UPI002486AA4A|nr:uncharacterized protein LOC129917135 [Episyrphus balteatus]
MSSSVFVETPRSASSGVGDPSSLLLNDDDDSTALGKADSNLVVVYGKNGINVDRKGLENLIDEKTLTSISVIRITSPTPSMEDEEAEEIRKEAEHQAQEDEESHSSADEDDEEENSDSEVEEKRTPKPAKTIVKTRPEILGLTVEEFYPPNEAKELAKEILKYAGVTPLKCNVDYEFQRYVIKNDHCYTPFTSPSQVNEAKLATEADTKQSNTNIRKLPVTNTTTVKQYLNKRKQNMDEQVRKINDKEKDKSFISSDHDDSPADDSKNPEEDQEEEGDEDFDDDGSDYTAESEESAESDNDRDSDSDFDVNNRHGNVKKKKNFVARRKKKEKQRAARSLIMQKAVNNKRRLQSQDHISHDEEMKSLTPQKVNKQPQDARKSVSSFTIPKTIAKKQVPDDVEPVVAPTTSVLPSIPADPPAPPRQLINIQSVQIVKPANKIVEPSPVQVRTYQMMKPATPAPPPVPVQIPASPQTVKQIVINKVIASPKGGFTDLSALLARSDNSLSNVRVAEINPDKPPSVKGFMPLGIESAAKNQLPAQISIQTHQSSSEIAAENDKQLDLIDSIVKDELDRSFQTTEKSTAIKENSIPDLVKMLESTEKAVLEKNNKISTTSFTSTSSVEAIDIANAPLLENADDDIPEDLLQHVVELMEDKSLQEAVEMEVLQQQEKQKLEKQQELEQQQLQLKQQQQQQQIKPIILPQSSSSMNLQLPIRPHAQIVMTTPLKQPKSIIEASISNTTTPSSSRDTTPTPTLNRSTNVTYLRREPIQIVRGNGRVITLPPIEAPTTRAKRRAQAQPTSDTSFNDSESCDVSMHSDTSLFADSSHVGERNDPVFMPTVAAPKEKPVKTANKKKTAAKSLKSVPKKAQEEGESQEDEDEDDPNKLWCVCRQPHNNRFMICCDVCEDWFHGTCVSITKAMGLEMEQNGVEWTCPKCVKKQDQKKQKKITDLFENKKTVVQLMPQLDIQKKSSPTVQSKITDVFNKKTVVQLMPQLDEQPKQTRSSLNHSDITLQEVPGENKHMIDLKKLQPGQFYTLTRTPTTKKVQAVKTPEPVQNKVTSPEVVLKKSSPESGGSVVGNITKRVIVLPNTTTTSPKAVSRGVAMVKASALQQQQLKFNKVSTAAEKKQFTIAKVQQQQQNKNVPTSGQITLGSNSIDSPTNSSSQQTKTSIQKQQSVELLTCIVCKKQARANSIYCSDDCIRKHAQNALNAVKVPEAIPPSPPVKLGPDEKKKKSKGLFEDLLSMADRKPKVERVCVLERRTGKLLTGSNAPTTLNLKKWLQDNPTFEVVQPGSAQALEIEKSKQKARPNVQSPTNTNTFMPLKSDGPIVTSVITLTPPAMPSPQPVFPKNVKQQDLNKSNTKSSNSPNVQQRQTTTPKQTAKQTQQQLNIKTDKSEKEKEKPLASPSLPSSSQKVLKKQLSAEKDSINSPTPIRETSEPVRVNVRRTLKEQLLIRIKEVSDEKKLSEEQVEEFVKATEYEMYRLFNKDIGAKYKAKYRSLMFNIKDRKNETLLLKICGKLIEPRQLVRMSPEELASQELAQWRENEAKHQLEMIKKSELDMLSCTKTYVLKTHKGEEVIEGKQADRVDLDISIPVEDVVTVLNNSIVSSTTEIEPTSLTPRKDNSFETDYNVQETATSSVAPLNSVATTTSDKKKFGSKERERDREKRHKSKDRHREKNRKRSRSRSRERHHKSSSSRKDERREKDVSRKEDHEPVAKAAKVVATVPIKQPVSQPQPQTAVSETKSIAPARPVVKKTVKTPQPSIEKFNLIDQILESTKTVEQAANLQKEKPTPVVTPSTQTATAPLSKPDSIPEVVVQKSKPQSPLATDSDQEPSSTVSISTPPEDPYFKYTSDGEASMWTGSINMIDVASFQVSLQTVSGNTYLLSKDLPDELDIVGRISPDTVWDYIGKIKRSPNKEVVVIRLVPSGESETNAYTILYKYLDKRKRLGVIKTTSSNIKDFYIMPLGVGQQMPSVLQPSENFEFYDDVMRPDMLLGIVIRIMGKRHSNASMRRKKEATVISNRTITSVLDVDGTTSFTPPGSPKPKNTDSSRSTQAAGSSRGIRMQQKSIDDEEFDIDAIIKAPITAKKIAQQSQSTAASVAAQKDDADEPYSPGGGSSDDDVSSQTIPVRDDDLKRKMDEINRQIEAQKMEIAGLLSHDQSSSLANISIPSNLQQILASIQSKPDPPSQPSTSGKVPPPPIPPPPMIGSLSQFSHDEEYTPEHSAISRDPKPSRLAQLSEAELLSMVPDNIDIASSNTSHKNMSASDQPPEKRPRWSEPPPPGMESDYT